MKKLTLGNLQGCQLCPSSLSLINKFNISEGFGKLEGYTTNKNPTYFLVGLTPSSQRFENLTYPFQISAYKNGRLKNELFHQILDELGISQSMMISNAVKCTTDNKHIPKAFDACKYLLQREYRQYEPQFVIALGSKVRKLLIESKFFRADEICEIYHPSYMESHHRISKEEYKQHIKEKLKL